MQYLLAALACTAMAIALWHFRQQREAAFDRRRRQLEISITLFDAHSRALEKFLDRKTAPIVLKRIVIHLSDALNNPDSVLMMAKLLARGDKLDPDQQDQEIVDALEKLRASDQDLFDCYSIAIVSGAFGAFLRWPESAVYFEEISAKLAADPNRDVDVVMTASRFREPAMPAFGLGAPVAA